MKISFAGPIGSNHGNLFKGILSLLFRRYGVLHAKFNGKGVGVGVGVGVGDGNRAVRGTGWSGRDGTGEAGGGKGHRGGSRHW